MSFAEGVFPSLSASRLSSSMRLSRDMGVIVGAKGRTRLEIVDEKSRPAEKLTQEVEKQIPFNALQILDSETPASRFVSLHE
jgi:hypothetical protein